jgi:plastocyanin domain-containing protein
MLGLLRRSFTSHRDVSREIAVRVRGGYDPETIYAEAGVPLRIVFSREESSPCSEQVVFPAFGKSATLPQGTKVAVNLLPAIPGVYEFNCGMGMLHGTLIVAPPAAVGHRKIEA